MDQVHEGDPRSVGVDAKAPDRGMTKSRALTARCEVIDFGRNPHDAFDFVGG